MGKSERINFVSYTSYSTRDAAFKKCKATQNDCSIENCRKKSDSKNFYPCAFNKYVGVLSKEKFVGNTYNGELETLAEMALLAVSTETLKHDKD